MLLKRQVFDLVVDTSLVLVLEVVGYNRDGCAVEGTCEVQVPLAPVTIVAQLRDDVGSVLFSVSQ